MDGTADGSVAVLGLGTMGGRTAAAMVEAGVEVHGYDPADGTRGRAASYGVRVYDDAADAVNKAEVVVLSLPGPSDVTAAADGPLQALTAGSIVVDLSTIDPGTAADTALTLQADRVDYVDTPVLGLPDRCGTWTLVAGGPQETIARVEPLLTSTIATRMVHVGEVGAGSTIKLANNLMFGAINTATVEALDLCRRSGVDPAVFVTTVAESGAGTVSNLFRQLGPKLVAADYDPVFALGLLHKDNRLALELALRLHGPAFVARCVDQVNSLGVDAGLARLDTGVVAELYQQLSPTDQHQQSPR